MIDNSDVFLSWIKEKYGIKGNIEEMYPFSTWFNENCTVFISKNEKKFFITLGIYDKSKTELGCIKLFSTTSKEIAKNRSDSLIKELNGKTPILAILAKGNKSIQLKDVVKEEKEIKVTANPDDCIEIYDVVKVSRKKVGVPYQHVAIYLGNSKVVHIPDPKNPTRKDSWEDFLEGQTQVDVYHPFIPFKRPELIQKHIDLTLNARYGEGEYHLFKKNCEHFATLCVWGIPFSRQSDSLFSLKEIVREEYLLKKIEKSKKIFNILEEKIDPEENEGLKDLYRDWLENRIGEETTLTIKVKNFEEKLEKMQLQLKEMINMIVGLKEEAKEIREELQSQDEKREEQQSQIQIPPK